MATALQKQLAAIAAASTHQLDLKAQKSAHGKSLLFDAKVAAGQSFDSLYLICHDGFRDLCALDSRFLQFSRSLFSEQSKAEDRTQMTKDENKKLNSVLEAFITLVGPRLLLKPAQKAVEWLVRRFRVHEYNTECLALAYLPYHSTPPFLALLSILPSQPPPSLRFLHPYIQSPTSPPRRTVVYTAVNTPAFFDALQAYTVRVVQAGHQTPALLSFWAGITLEAVVGILDHSSTGRRELEAQKTEGLVLRVLPALNSCMRAKSGSDTVLACYTLVAALVGRAELGDKMLDGLMEAALLAHSDETLDACLALLALIAEQRSNGTLPARVEKRLLVIPQLVQKLLATSKQCRVHHLALGCAVGALTGIATSDENASIFQNVLAQGLLTESQSRTIVSTLIDDIHNAAAATEERGHLLQLAFNLAETPFYLDTMRGAAKAKNIDLASLGIEAGEIMDIDTGAAESEDEDMIDADADGETERSQLVEIPSISAQSFLQKSSASEFDNVAQAFSQAISANSTTKFLRTGELRQKSATSDARYLTFLARLWSSNRPNPVRYNALRAATRALKQGASAASMQNLLPYLVVALADASTLVRRAAGACIVTLSKSLSSNKVQIWAAADLYGKDTKIPELKTEDAITFLGSVLVPILEESAMDSNFAIPAVRDLLEGTQNSKLHPKYALKVPTRTSILNFLAYHTSHTPLLQVRLTMLPLFNFHGKASESIRSQTILPLLRRWCELSGSEASSLCASEQLALPDIEQKHLLALVAKDAKSVSLLREIMTGALNKDRLELVNATFDRISAFWSAMKSASRLILAQDLLNAAFNDSQNNFDKLCRERSLELLRNVKLDSVTLVSFLESVPSAVQMPEGPPAKKRRRTSRNELARVELSSEQDLQNLLKKLTIVLELIEGSNPGQHPALFPSLFNVFGELQPLKQRSGSELVYLQSMILGALAPIVDTLKEQPDSGEYQSAVRADLLIDCIRHSTSPQVQNSALLLIANLASWVPEQILHNLMPIFTFIGSTLLRQQDDYSAQVVDKTISRVVPQLAASLRFKHKNFLIGVSDLLLSFTAAFEHIPLHRRLKLFSELARTLSPDVSLPAILALLADRYHNSKSQRRFSVELLLVFDPINTLDAFNGYLELVLDAASSKRKITDTLFALNEKSPAQVETSVRDLLSSLADLPSDERLRAHVSKAFRSKSDADKPRAVFASIVENTVQLAKKVASSPKLYDGCSRVLAKSLDLLPTADLIKSAEVLLTNVDHQVQTAAIKAVELRAGKAVQNDSKSVHALIEFLPRLETILHQSPQIETKIISLSCIDRIIERFGKKDVAAVASVAEAVAGPHALADNDDRVRVLSLLCLTSVIDVLDDGAISLLPTIIPTAFEYLSYSIEAEKPGVHNAVFTLLSNVVERLGYMFSREHLETALRKSHQSAVAAIDDSCDESRQSFFAAVSECLNAQEVFAAIKSTWAHAISQDADARLEHLKLMKLTIDSRSKSQMAKCSSTLFSLILQLFNVRQELGAADSEEDDNDEMEELDGLLIESTMAMVLKLNDATFRPFFVQLMDQQGPTRNITLYRFLEAFFDKFKSIVTSYASYMMEHAAKLLGNVKTKEDDKEVREAVLSALRRSFEHDQDGFWQAPSHHGTVLKPITNLLAVEGALESRDQIIDTITELAASSSSSSDNHRELNTILLRYMRHDSASTRLATVKCEQALTQRLGEEWLSLLPEMLPFVSELRDDDDEMVERETQRWISMVEEVLGESLEGMLQ